MQTVPNSGDSPTDCDKYFWLESNAATQYVGIAEFIPIDLIRRKSTCSKESIKRFQDIVQKEIKSL